MPFNGSGGTSQPTSSIYPAVASTLIESAKFNISVADIYTMLASCIVKDGQQTTTAVIPFASGIKTDDISENTAGDGVTIDGALLKDGRIDTTQGTDIACAATLNLETATGNVVDVTGSTGPVTAVTLSQGHWRLVRFTGTPTFTDGASLILPGGENITVAAGDYMLFIGYASSVVRIAAYWPVTGAQPFLDSNPVVVGATDQTKKVRVEVDGLTTATTRVITMPDEDVSLAGASDTAKGLIEVAVQSEMESASSTTLAVTPGRMKYGPGVAKAWAVFNGTGPTMLASHNFSTTITSGGAGVYGLSFSTAMSSANYAVLVTSNGTGAGRAICGASSPSTSGFGVNTADASNTLTDFTLVYVVVFGDL